MEHISTIIKRVVSDAMKNKYKGIDTIYLAGKITGDPVYREKFNKYKDIFEALGYIVLNPAILPDGFEYEDYMTICFAMIDVCKAIAFLPDYKDSPGALREEAKAIKENKVRIYLTEGATVFKYDIEEEITA